jgi:hypothetical protein
MSSRQKFKDIVLLLKRDRKAQVLTAGIMIMFLWGIMGDHRPRRQRPTGPAVLDAGSGAMSNEEAYQDLVTRFSNDLDMIKKTTAKNSEELNAYRQYTQQQEERTAEIFKRVLERIADIEGTVQNQSAISAGPVDVSAEDLPDIEEDSLEPWGDLDEEEVAPPAAPEDRKIAFIGAGDSVRVKLIAGVDAPTDGTPYPVIFKLNGDVDGPDGSALPLGEARLIAAAQGSLTNQRALFRLTQMNVRYPDGSRKVTNVDGWVVGEDGLRGMEGVLIDPVGKALAGSFAAGFAEGVGEGIEASNQLTVVTSDGSFFNTADGDILEYAFGAGLGQAGERWGEFIDDRARLLVPHVRVFSGREATAIFSRNVELDGLHNQLEDENFQFVSLD